MRVKFFLTTIFLISLIVVCFSNSPKIYADKGCCIVTVDSNINRTCATPAPCDTSIKSCDTTDNVPGTAATNPDVNGDGVHDGKDAYNPSCFVAVVAPASVKIKDFGKLFTGAVSLLLLVAFILAFLYLILGGIAWVTSGGDKAGIEAARNKIINALIGLIVVASTWAIFQLVGGAIGFNILGGFTIPTFF